MKYFFGILFISFIFSSTSLTAASFDCTKATTDIEKTICSNDELSKADEILGKLYSQLQRTLSRAKFKQLKIEQHTWLKEGREERCDHGDEYYNCLLTRYNRRILDLKFAQSTHSPIFPLSDSLSTILPMQSKNLNAFIPEGWHILFKNKIHLTNKRGKNYVFIIEKQEDKDDRILFIVIQSEKGEYHLNAATSRAVYGPAQSGRFVDVLINLITKKNSFTVVHYHGGRWNHGFELTFSYKNGKWLFSRGVGCSAVEIAVGTIDPDIRLLAEVYYTKHGEQLQNFNVFSDDPSVIFKKIVEREKLHKYLQEVVCD